MTKKWYTSKTIWIAILEIGVGAVFAGIEAVPDWTAIAMIAFGAGHTILRIITGQPIGK